ncbi:hypothetical protein ACEQ8H_002422 [Pleosporales sp. CAS-2024a]
MAPHAAYGGPTALGYSKYASHGLAQLPLFPAAVSSTKPALFDSTIATQEQIAATHDESVADAPPNESDAQLAIDQGHALKKEVDQHTAQVSRALSSTSANTKRLLELLRETLSKDDPLALKPVDDLWNELEVLYQAAQDTKEALPAFLEKQRNNMALYHSSVLNETFRDSQAELNMQHKKVNIQHGLILEQQQAFQEYKAQTSSKLKDLEDLQERVSRLTLEKGNFRDEVDKYARLLQDEQATKTEDLKKVGVLQKELASLVASKKQLLAEVDGLQMTIGQLQDKMQVSEQHVTDRFTSALKEKTDLLAKEIAKSSALNTLINTLNGQESNAKMEVAKAKEENRLLNDKYSRIAAEHSTAFSKSNDQIKKIKALSSDVERLHKERDKMQSQLTKLPELEKQNTILFKEKSDLLKQVDKLSIELKEAKDNCAKTNNELASSIEKLHETQIDTEAQKKESTKSIQALETAVDLEKENTKLKTLVSQLQANQVAPTVGGTQHPGSNTPALESNIQDLEAEKHKLQLALNEWIEVAKRSYKEYKDMLPTYKEADKFRKAAQDAEQLITALREDLAKARASQSNDAAPTGDAAYWKAKYDSLLNTVS